LKLISFVAIRLADEPLCVVKVIDVKFAIPERRR